MTETILLILVVVGLASALGPLLFPGFFGNGPD